VEKFGEDSQDTVDEGEHLKNRYRSWMPCQPLIKQHANIHVRNHSMRTHTHARMMKTARVP